MLFAEYFGTVFGAYIFIFLINKQNLGFLKMKWERFVFILGKGRNQEDCSLSKDNLYNY